MTEKKHILFIHQFATTYDEPGEIRHIEMFKSLKDKGIRVTVISGSVNYQTGVHYPDFKGFSQEKELAGISRSFIAFYRIYCAPTYRKGFIGRILNYISFLITSFIFSLSIKNVDIVLATSPSLFTGLAGWFISLFRSRPFFFEMRDLWPKVAVEMGLLKNKSLIDIAYWLEKFLCLKAVRNIVITEGYAGYIESIGINRNKIAIVENGVDSWMVEHKITHDDCPGIIEKIKDKFLVMYVGAIGKFNYLDEMLKADLKISRRDDIHFVFVGDGGERKALEEYASNEKLSNVHFTGSVSKEIIPSYLQWAGVCFSIYPFIPTGSLLLQNKVLDYMSMAKPVLLIAPEGDTSRIIEKADCGFCIQTDTELIAKKIIWFLENPDKRVRMGENGRDYVRRNLLREDLAVKFAEALNI